MDVSPSPWMVELKNTKTGQSLQVIDQNCGVVALVKNGSGRKLSNAYVLAAAPELLEVVERFVAACNAYLPAPTHQAFCGLFAAADAAIAKAKGRQE